MRFTDKVCLVTGGGSGIGRASCERFAAEGGKVVVVDANVEHGAEAARAITEAGGEAIFAKADVSVSTEVQAAVRAAVDLWGRIDVLVNNAAMMTFEPITELADEDWDKVMAVNLRSVFLFCKYACRTCGAVPSSTSVRYTLTRRPRALFPMRLQKAAWKRSREVSASNARRRKCASTPSRRALSIRRCCGEPERQKRA
jgi:NAD(P)-dependent dehydrogenase (short-subunit alcohol dehydrogenase family)